MKKTLWKKALALTLASATALSLCACGGGSSSGNGTSGKKSDEKYYQATYLELPASYGDNMYYSVIKGNKLYYAGSNDEYTQSSIHVYDLDTKEDKLIWQSEPYSYDMGTSSDVSNLSADNNGNVLVRLYESRRVEPDNDYSNTTQEDVLNYFVDNWGYDYNQAVDDWNNYYVEQYTKDDGTVDYGKFLKDMNSTWESSNKMVMFDANGNQVWEKSADVDNSDGSNYYISSIVMTDDGDVAMLTNKWDDSSDSYYIELYGNDGNLKNTITLDGYADSMFTLPDGSVAYTVWGDTGYTCKVVNTSTGKVDDEYSFQYGTPYVKDQTHLYIKGDSSLSVYDLKTQETTKLFSWLDVDMSSSSVNAVGTSSDGKLMVLSRSYSSTEQKYVPELAIVEEVDASVFKDVTFLTYASMYVDWDVEQRLLEFNRKHNDVKFRALTFDQGSDWETNYNQFITALSTNKDIDLISFTEYSQVMNLAAKGMLYDLSDVLDKAGSLKKDDIVPGILKACEVDGKLVTLPTGFTLSTMVGKTENVGPNMGWTIDQAKQVWDSMPAGTEFSTGSTRNEIMRTLISLNYSKFVDVSKASCHFDDEEFVKLLEFAAKFPEEIDWSTYEYDDDRFINNQVLVDTYWLSSLYDFQGVQANFGGDITLIGYPSDSTNGAFFSFNNMYGITKNCEMPEVAWEFLSQYYEPVEYSEGGEMYRDSYGYYGFSIRMSEFEEMCKSAMDEKAPQVGQTWGWGNYEYTVRPATQEEVDLVMNLVNETTSVYGAASDAVINLIMEEAEYYFNGERTADEVAKKVQSRMSIYLSETN